MKLELLKKQFWTHKDIQQYFECGRENGRKIFNEAVKQNGVCWFSASKVNVDICLQIVLNSTRREEMEKWR